MIPLTIGTIACVLLIQRHEERWLTEEFLPRCSPIAIAALLLTLVLIFAFQADNILGKAWHVLLIAVPLIFASLSERIARLCRHAECGSALFGGRARGADRSEQLL
ncbi:hypothetical protein NSPZN2_100081 [Nitrospira defluvii]|uniref:Uncharacterized protein n=1 Tax=Nitrospira defluvii TaxID=330214 RepID=A0ABM8QZX4_9BACT|nr:hypothetical protein NSPZN2_100081 [Nitrospira defluvii]